MATKQSTVDFLVDQLSAAGNVRARKMFGEYGLYCDEKIVALICDDQLFVKPSPVEKDFQTFCQAAPPYPGAKLYWQVLPEKWDDAEWLSQFVRQTAAALPAALPKKRAS